MTASQVTPFQAKLMQEARERRARMAAAAKPDTPIMCLSASERALAFTAPIVELSEAPAKPVESVQEWTERQIHLYRPWFSIVEEIDPPKTAVPSIRVIQRLCADYYEVSVLDLLSIRRSAELVKARQVAMYLSKEFTSKSLPEIGRRFGGRDHTTVIHALRKIKEKESSDKEMADDLNALRQQIREQL